MNHITADQLIASLPTLPHMTTIEAHKSLRTRKFTFAIQVDRDVRNIDGREYTFWAGEAFCMGYFNAEQIATLVTSNLAEGNVSDFRLLNAE